jgi:hypothetical protein
LTLSELCGMLWDMIRYKNFDTDSPYNREAAVWAKQQASTLFPLDHRPIRDKIAIGAVNSHSAEVVETGIEIVRVAERKNRLETDGIVFLD